MKKVREVKKKLKKRPKKKVLKKTNSNITKIINNHYYQTHHHQTVSHVPKRLALTEHYFIHSRNPSDPIVNEPVINEPVEPEDTTIATPQNPVAYQDLKVISLKEIAKDRGIPGYYRMRKEELIQALTETD